MIDATRALLVQTDREIERLVALRDSLAAFIEQPGQGAGPDGQAARTESAPVSAPRAEAVRNGSRTSAVQAEERGFDSRPPLQPLTCTYCGREFPNRRGLPMHEGRCEKNPDRLPPWAPQPETGQPPRQLRPTRETFLCDRCQDPFPSRQALSEHRRSHPEVPPAPGPMRRAGTLSQLGVG